MVSNEIDYSPNGKKPEWLDLDHPKSSVNGLDKYQMRPKFLRVRNRRAINDLEDQEEGLNDFCTFRQKELSINNLENNS